MLLATDFEFGREQRKTGLPAVGSQLGLDVSVLDQHGLLHPRGIITRVQRERRERASEPEGTIDLAAEEAKNRPAPHYMQNTGCNLERMETKAAVIANVRGLRELRERNRFEARTPSPTPRASEPSPAFEPAPEPGPTSEPTPRARLRPRPSAAEPPIPGPHP